MIIHRIRSFEEYLLHLSKNKKIIKSHDEYLSSYIPKKRKQFKIPGYSYTANKTVDFIVDYQHSGGGRINWRERVCCPITGYNNRQRATIHLFDIEMEAYPESEIYLTEQTTPMYQFFRDRYNKVIGSEYLGHDQPKGVIGYKGLRNEDLTGLTFEDNSFDILISLDVLEHIPDYEKAFQECERVLRKKGKILFSVPFVPMSENNLVRAKIENGTILHLQPAEYHGDPLSNKDILCFQHFGWQMLKQFRSVGFKDAYALCYHSNEFGYLGGDQFLFVAQK